MMMSAVLVASQLVYSTQCGPQPDSGQVGQGQWIAHNEQGNLAPWIKSDDGFPEAHVTVECGASATIEWYKFGFDLDDSARYSATAVLMYRIETDEPTGYSYVARVSNGTFKPHNEQGFSIVSLPLEPTAGEWATRTITLGVFRGDVLNAPQTKMLFNIAPLMDLGFKVEVNVTIVATPVE